jgi:hypothetical protein
MPCAGQPNSARSLSTSGWLHIHTLFSLVSQTGAMETVVTLLVETGSLKFTENVRKAYEIEKEKETGFRVLAFFSF